MENITLRELPIKKVNQDRFPIAFYTAVNRNLMASRNFSVLTLFLDGFKAINTRCEHNNENLILSCFTDVATDCIRETDQLYRYSRDEFSIILNNALKESTAIIACRIQKAITEDNLLSKHNIYCRIGITHSSINENADTLLARVNEALADLKNIKNNYAASK